MFVDKWKELLTRAWSIQLAALVAIGNLALELVPYLGDYVPESMRIYVTAGMLALAVFARLVDQGIEKPKAEPEDPPVGIGA